MCPGVSSAMQFDIWETGMSIQEVVGLARKHDLPIAREGLIPGSKRFDPKLINEEFYKASAVHYRTTISGRSSIVYLRMTEDSKFVREIEVKLFGIANRESFTEEILGILDRKYGRHEEGKESLFTFYQWKPDQHSQVRMRIWATEASIIYRDLRIKGYHEEQKSEKEKGTIRKDAPKF
jgi:hypothetical protein